MRHVHLRSPSFFVMGVGRSGTSLLQSLLSLHPSLLVSHELRVLELARIAAHCVEGGGEPDPTASVSRFSTELGLVFAASLGAAQLAEAGKEGASYGDKYPPYCERVDELRELFPAARLVHIVRDGRDVVASSLQAFVADRGWRREAQVPSVSALARHWATWVARARTDGRAAGAEHYFEFRYEDLLNDPRGTLRALLAFLGVAPDASLDAMASRVRPGKSWRETLSIQDLDEFDACAAARTLCLELGYPPTPPPAAGDAEVAAWTRGARDPRAWAELGIAAARAGDEARAVFAWLRACWRSPQDARARIGLLGLPHRPESLFAAFGARTEPDAEMRRRLARWMVKRGLDERAAAAVMALEIREG